MSSAQQLIRSSAEHLLMMMLLLSREASVRSVKVNEDMVNLAIDIVSEHPVYTLMMINQDLRLRLPNAPHVTPSTI